MRNPDRIHRIMVLLEILWNRVPDWRLGQLVSNLLGPGVHDVFYVEDDDWEGLIKKALKEWEITHHEGETK